MINPQGTNADRVQDDPKERTMCEQKIRTFLDSILAERVDRGLCTVEPVRFMGEEGPEENITLCDGNLCYGDAEVTQWLRLLVINFGQAAHDLSQPAVAKINELPFHFNY